MKITNIEVKTVHISSPIRNAYIDFSKMTASAIAITTDVLVDGKPVFSINGSSKTPPSINEGN